ncbi:MAG: FAD binding domain-containing protein [Anaerolineales bacterium]
MITEYHRPVTLEAALKLLRRKQPQTRPLGGGTILAAPSSEAVAVIDLQALKLNKIALRGKNLHIGATATLQALLDTEGLQPALSASIGHEATYNLRQVATVAGSLVAVGGRSPFAAAMLVLDAQLELQPKDEAMSYGDLLALRLEKLRGKLITKVTFSLAPKLSYQYVARTPADLAIVSVTVAQWPSGRTRLVVGGFGPAPVLALDGRDSSGLPEALENALSAASDQWASAEYRIEAAKALLVRAVSEMQDQHD